MEPDNRPYVAPDTKPGDSGTEEWAETLPEADDVDRGPLPAGTTDADADGIVDGSPADELINDPNAVAARKDRPTGA